MSTRAASVCSAVIALAIAGCSLQSASSLLPAASTGPKESTTLSPQVSPLPRPAEKSGMTSCSSAERTKNKANQLVVALTAEFKSPAPAEKGSAIFIGEDASSYYLLTALHVIELTFPARQRATTIRVTLPNGTEAVGRIPPMQPALDSIYRDIAVIAIPRGTATQIEWDRLQPFDSVSIDQEARIVGNGAGRIQSETAYGPLKTESSSIKVNAIAEGGMSGGGIFNRQNQLIGMTVTNSSGYAEGYPIAPVLSLAQRGGIPLALRPAQKERPNIFLAAVSGEPDLLRRATDQELAQALTEKGLEPACASAGAFRLNVAVDALYPSGSRTIARLKPELRTAEGGLLLEQAEEEGLHHWPWSSPFNSIDSLRTSIRPVAKRIVDRAAALINERRY